MTPNQLRRERRLLYDELRRRLTDYNVDPTGKLGIFGTITMCFAAVCILPLWQALVYATFVVIAIHGSLSALGTQIYSLKQRFGLIPAVIVCSLIPVVLFFIFNWYQSHTFLELLVLAVVGSALTIVVIDVHQSIKIKRQKNNKKYLTLPSSVLIIHT
jgi:hypothetical protein